MRWIPVRGGLGRLVGRRRLLPRHVHRLAPAVREGEADGLEDVVRCRARPHHHDPLVPLPVGVRLRRVDDDLPHRDAVRVDRVDLVGPVGPVGQRVRVRRQVPDPERRVAPVDDRARVARLEDAHVGEAALLVGHRLGAADHAGRERLRELVVVPDAVLGHPVRDVARSAPEGEPVGRLVEAHDHVGLVADAPGVVPALVVAQARVDGAERGTGRSAASAASGPRAAARPRASAACTARRSPPRFPPPG